MWEIHEIFREYNMRGNIEHDLQHLEYMVSLYEWCVKAHVCGRGVSYKEEDCERYNPECDCAERYAEIMLDGFRTGIVNTLGCASPKETRERSEKISEMGALGRQVIFRVGRTPGTFSSTYIRAEGLVHSIIRVTEENIMSGIMKVIEDVIEEAIRPNLTVFGQDLRNAGEFFEVIEGRYWRVYMHDYSKRDCGMRIRRQKSARK